MILVMFVWYRNLFLSALVILNLETVCLCLKLNLLFSFYVLVNLYHHRLDRRAIVNTLRGKDGLHAFGNNSNESEPIWMKSRKVSQMWGLAPADFGCDLCSSDSLRRSFCFKKTQKLLTKFSGIAISGRRNSAVLQMPKPHGHMVPLRDV